jgi:hypothetical protein
VINGQLDLCGYIYSDGRLVPVVDLILLSFLTILFLKPDCKATAEDAVKVVL